MFLPEIKRPGDMVLLSSFQSLNARKQLDNCGFKLNRVFRDCLTRKPQQHLSAQPAAKSVNHIVSLFLSIVLHSPLLHVIPVFSSTTHASAPLPNRGLLTTVCAATSRDMNRPYRTVSLGQMPNKLRNCISRSWVPKLGTGPMTQKGWLAIKAGDIVMAINC